ncbi:MAG TPA: CDP-diacylglycerol--glycerol-3-phosphate 3-phosphatidyltransferase [Nocardioidaceae bacterium]|nr:CDP-diacylglycerol--glycerol-3-phosphate 3-phosphatidyltransferase [Nocardioidaceae bacterium]
MTTPGRPAAPPSNWNLPNALTLLRILMVPLFGWLLLSNGGDEPVWRVAAFGCFLAAMLTDRLDGEIARRRGLVTNFGKIADPIADKALTGTAFVGLSLLGELSWWVTVIVLGRELLITLVRFVVIRYGVIAASRGGKLKTVLQVVALCAYILPVGDVFVLHLVAVGVMAAAVVVTVWTGGEYAVHALRVWREGRAAERP